MNSLKQEIHNKSLDLKKKIKELNNILINLYNDQKDKNNKNILLIKKNADKFNSASKKINSLDLNIFENLDKKEEIDMDKLKKDTLKNIRILQDFYKKKLKDNVSNSDNIKIPKIKRNLDNLNLAFNDISRIEVNFELRQKELDT